MADYVKRQRALEDIYYYAQQVARYSAMLSARCELPSVYENLMQDAYRRLASAHVEYRKPEEETNGQGAERQDSP